MQYDEPCETAAQINSILTTKNEIKRSLRVYLIQLLWIAVTAFCGKMKFQQTWTTDSDRDGIPDGFNIERVQLLALNAFTNDYNRLLYVYKRVKL